MYIDVSNEDMKALAEMQTYRDSFNLKDDLGVLARVSQQILRCIDNEMELDMEANERL